MTHFWTRTAGIALAAAAAAACTTGPQYPTTTDGQPGGPLTMPRPNFPVRQESTAPAQADPAPAAQPSGGTVQSQPLPPPAASTAPAPTAVESRPLSDLTPAEPPRTVTQTRTVTVAGGKVVDTAGKPQTYEVQGGDTLIGIARKLDTSIDQLARDNDLEAPYNIRPGQTLKGPATKSKAYVVESGDTLYAIARRFGVSAQSIAEANDMELSSSIRVGQRVALPPGFRDNGPTTRTVTTQVPAPPTATPVQTAARPVTPTPQPVARPAPVQTVQATPPRQTATTLAPVTRPAATTPPAATTAPPVTTAARPVTPAPSSTTRPIIATNAPPTDNEVATAGQGRFIWPVRGEVISGFGPKGVGQRNDGLNVRAAAGTTVRAAAAGEVVYAGDQVPGFGNLVLVKHEDGWVTAYAHLSRADVKMRQQVTQGQTIGQVGASGGVAEPQLHFEVRYAPTPKDKARPIDPSLVLPRS